MNGLIPAAAILIGPLLLLAPVVWVLAQSPQQGRHTGIRVPDWLNPYDLRIRDAFRHYADKEREPYEESDDVIWNRATDRDLCGSCDAGLPMSCTCRDLTGAFPVVRAA